uniref:Uncharacterized protein n=1 Tax=Pavo cristatus TaxID=9049 RepID=A0A8C9FFS6_PAVCR
MFHQEVYEASPRTAGANSDVRARPRLRTPSAGLRQVKPPRGKQCSPPPGAQEVSPCCETLRAPALSLQDPCQRVDGAVLTPCRRWALSGLQQRPAAAPLSAAPPARFYAAAAKNAKRVSQKAKQEEAQKKKGRVRRLLLSKPVDDVYLTWYYERPSYNVEEAVGMLKKFQELDFTYPKQFVYINVTLDMQLQKKKKVDQFASIVLLPYRFTDETNKVLVFTEVSKPELLIYICHEPSMLLCQN